MPSTPIVSKHPPVSQNARPCAAAHRPTHGLPTHGQWDAAAQVGRPRLTHTTVLGSAGLR